MNSKTILSLIAGVIAICTPLSAQYADVRGTVSDYIDHFPIAYANVVLMQPDSVFVSGTISDDNGVFYLKEVVAGDYLLSTSYLGYESQCMPFRHEGEDFLEISLSASSFLLDDVTIQAQLVIRKADRQLLLPSQAQLRASADGLDLLHKMQLPRLMVDPLNNEITVSGHGEVQLRINGVQVSAAEISALDPADLVRIEYHDDPGARYGNAAVVIDCITRRRESGGSIRGSAMHNLGGNKTSADDLLAAKFNYKKSEFSVHTTYQHRKQNWTREYEEAFVYPTHTLYRTEIGEPTLFDKKRFYTHLNYSLTAPGTYFFNAQLRYTYLDFPSAYEDRRSKLYMSGSDTPLSIYDHTWEKSRSPALDLYFQRQLPGDQHLILNVVGTYLDTKNSRIYQESRHDIYEADIYSHIEGQKYSLIAEGVYDRVLGEGRFTTGMKHSQSHTHNNYTGTTVADVGMGQAESSLYGEFQQRLGRWGYMLNMTLSRIYYSQDRASHEKYMLQPSARLTYDPTSDLSFRYRISMRNNTPSLAFLNDVEQQIDPLQVRRGNPDLDSFRSLHQALTVGYKQGIFGLDLLVNYDQEFNPIMESVWLEEDRFVRSYENQRAFRNLGAELTFRLKPWKDHILLSVTPKVNRFISHGNDYNHVYTMKELRVNLDLCWQNWVANFTTITPYRYMYGEQLNKSDQMYTIMAGYKASHWSVMLGGLSPFTRTYKAHNENWSAVNPVRSDIHTRNMTQMLFVKCSFNVDFGKQVKAGNKRLQNMDTESGIMSGSKS
ncbi:MAG: TonB-dependent receptor [Bacteroides sp.]|nr:TonB-dependent receptor [Bacteroides sp.]